MSRIDGKSNKNNYQGGKSYGIFGEAVSSIKQKLNFDGFESSKEGSRQPRENSERREVRQPKPPVRQNVPQPNNPRNFFVFDVETIPCIETARTFLKLGAEVSEEEVIAKLKAYHLEATGGQNEFFRQLFHKVVCISFIAGTIHTFKGGKEKYVIKTIRSGGRNGESEEEILKGVFTYLNKHPSRLVSFNGRGFDMPVLQYRAMKYGIDAKWIYNDGYYNYNHRYSIEKHCDLLEMFSNFGASARIKLEEICALFKLPCKANGVDGSNIYNLFKENKLEEIADYCENDVIATYILYLRFMQHSGKLSAEGYNICLDNLCTMLKSEEARPSHTLFVEQLMQMNNGNPYISLPQGAFKQEVEEEVLGSEEGFESSTENEENSTENEENSQEEEGEEK